MASARTLAPVAAGALQRLPGAAHLGLAAGAMLCQGAAVEQHGQRQIADGDGAPVAVGGEELDGQEAAEALQLADVPVPRGGAEQVPDLVLQEDALLKAAAAGLPVEEQVHQVQDLIPAVAQPGHLEPEVADPVEEVATETAGFGVGLDVAVGGEDEADVDRRRGEVAQAVDSALIEDAAEVELELG